MKSTTEINAQEKTKTVEERTIYDWKHDASIRAEFPNIGIYHSYLKYEEERQNK